MHPILLELYAKEKQKMLIEEARIDGLLRLARKSRPKMRESLFIRIGDLLISLGYRLIEKYEPMLTPNSKARSKYKCCPEK